MCKRRAAPSVSATRRIAAGADASAEWHVRSYQSPASRDFAYLSVKMRNARNQANCRDIKEPETVNQLVVGSIPTAGAKEFSGLSSFAKPFFVTIDT